MLVLPPIPPAFELWRGRAPILRRLRLATAFWHTSNCSMYILPEISLLILLLLPLCLLLLYFPSPAATLLAAASHPQAGGVAVATLGAQSRVKCSDHNTKRA